MLQAHQTPRSPFSGPKPHGGAKTSSVRGQKVTFRCVLLPVLAGSPRGVSGVVSCQLPGSLRAFKVVFTARVSSVHFGSGSFLRCVHVSKEDGRSRRLLLQLA